MEYRGLPRTPRKWVHAQVFLLDQGPLIRLQTFCKWHQCLSCSLVLWFLPPPSLAGTLNKCRGVGVSSWVCLPVLPATYAGSSVLGCPRASYASGHSVCSVSLTVVGACPTGTGRQGRPPSHITWEATD